MPTERPILMSAPMVRAILEGRKTQTRRVMKDAPGQGRLSKPCVYGIPGDRLWVRETFQPLWNEHHEETPNWKTGEGYAISYVATSGRQEYDDDEHGLTDHCKPAIFMPRWASRITLEITKVRVQRLQEISEEDAIAEGVEKRGEFPNITPWRNYQAPEDCPGCMHFSIARRSFNSLWGSINAKRGFGWDMNPWVWAITFQKLGAA